MKKVIVKKSLLRNSPQAVFSDKIEQSITEGVIQRARGTGKLILTSRNLDKVPEGVFEIDTLTCDEKQNLDMKFDSDSGSKWWDIVPLTVLNLSSNAIQSIPPEIKNLKNLSQLMMQHNSIASIADELGELQYLSCLQLDHNKLKTFPKCVYMLTNLKTLSASYNVLEVVDEELGNLVMLSTLNLSNNSLSFIPDNIGFLGKISDLNLSHNNLHKVPVELTTICALKTLNLSSNKIEELPTLQFLEKLEDLNLRNNKLKIMPDVSNCVKLHSLDLSQNAITELDGKVFNNLMVLRVLYLSENKLQSLPDEICNLAALISLDVSCNSLTELPSKLCTLKRLRYLLIGENTFHTIPRHVIAAGTRRLLLFLKERYSAEVADNPSKSNDTLQAALEKMRVSKTLKIRGSNLNAEALVEGAVSAQTSVINLFNCQLKELPENFRELARYATEVDLAHNLLTQLPSYIESFSYLIYLSLAENRLATLPAGLAGCQQIKELRIDHNNFTEVPAVVYELVNLEILNCKGNKITSINVEGLNNLKKLAVFDLSDNSIGHVPPELGNMTQLRCLHLEGNTFRVPNFTVLAKGTRELLKYLHDKIPLK